MRQFAILLLAALALAVSPLRAQSSTDPGDLFVNAYMAVQQGEKAEQSGNFKLALSKLRSAASVLDDIATHYPSWQPSIVDYRRSRTADAISRVQEKIAHAGSGQVDGSGAAASADAPPLPQADNEKPLVFENPDTPLPAPSAPPASGTGPRKGHKSQAAQPQGAGSDLLEQAAQRMKKLQDDLQAAKAEAEQLQSEKAKLAGQLTEAANARVEAEKKQKVLQERSDNAEQALMKAMSDGKGDTEKVRSLQAEVASARKALKDMRIEADADTEYRKELDDRYRFALTKMSQLTQERDSANQTSASVPGKIESIQKELDKVKKEKDDLAAKLQQTETQLSKVTSERDDALAQVSKLQEAQKNVAKLVEDNTRLMAQLDAANKTITQFKRDNADKDQQIASLKTELGSVRAELVQVKTQSAEYQRQMADLQKQLEESGKQLAEAKAENTATTAEKKKMETENLILRGIVLRQQKEEAVRAKTRKVVLGELSDLEIHSKSLLKQIDFLSQPVVKLTEKERSLFKKPELQISDTEISIGGTDDTAAKKDDAPAAPAVDSTAAVSAAPAAPVPVAPEPAPAPAPAPEVVPTLVPTTPAPAPTVEITPASTPTKSRHGKADASKTASNTPKPVEQPPLPTADTASVAPAPAPVGAPSVPATQATSLDIGPLALNKQSTTPTEPSTTAPQQAAPDSSAPASADAGGVNSGPGGAPNVPAELLPLAREGKDQFEKGNYLEAEKVYRKILAKAPNNLYTLSNLGVVLFRAAKFKLAEETFKKAIAIAPEDGFSHCTLGIVYYSQGKYDDAVNELTKALAIDPKNATAHNYLGITASQKGWQEAAQKELETATTLDPSYADAHFNLAVVFATQTPPNKESARKYYQRATELGAERDAALEQLIK